MCKVKNARGPLTGVFAAVRGRNFHVLHTGMLEVQAQEFNDCLMIYPNVGLCMRGVWGRGCGGTLLHNLEMF